MRRSHFKWLFAALMLAGVLVAINQTVGIGPPSLAERHARRVNAAMENLEKAVYVFDCDTSMCWALMNGVMSPVDCKVLNERHVDVTWVNGC